MIFHPQLFSGNPFLYRKFVLPVLENPDFEYRYFSASHPFPKQIAEVIGKVNALQQAGNVCRSKCCAIFKQYLDHSPMNFLNQYRLQVSCQLLGKENLTITDIAGRCGFVHNSYYGQVFRQTYGCSPKEYREMVYG